MGLLDKIRELFSPNIFSIYPMGWEDLGELIGDVSPSMMFRTQPHLRTVINFRARNIAQVGVHSYTRVDETDRRRDRTSPIARLLLQPNETTTPYELIFSLIADLDLYDRAFWVLSRSSKTISGWQLRRIPPTWVAGKGGDAFQYQFFRVQNPNGPNYVDVPADQMITFHGYSPISERDGSSPITALKEILKEQLSAMIFRNQVWQKGGKFSAVITRPAGVRWNETQRNAFREDWNRRFVNGNASDIGGTPILEDGMTLQRLDHSSAEQQYIEGAKLALTTVAAAYHVSPVMVGILDNANYSNVREFRKMLYGDTLGPTIAMIESRLNTFLLPKLGVDSEETYLEFNIAEKLQGNFEEQTDSLNKATGRPWMTVNETRARLNMPALDGNANEIATPLNLLIGQQSEGSGDGVEGEIDATSLKSLIDAAAALIRSGFDPGESLALVGLDPIKHLGLLPITLQKPTIPAGEEVDQETVDELKARRIARAVTEWPQYKAKKLILPDSRKLAVREAIREGRAALRTQMQQMTLNGLEEFFNRQKQVVSSRLGAKDASWWDQGRWDAELKRLLLPLGHEVSLAYAREALEEIAVPPDAYDQARTQRYLETVAEKMAQQINARTEVMITGALDEKKDWRESAAFTSGRRERLSRSTVTGWAAFGVHEAGAQVGAGEKTWITGHNPRPLHASMDGETVGLDEAFSNGQMYPGSGGGENSGCNCSMSLQKG